MIEWGTRRPGLGNKAPYELINEEDEDMWALFHLLKMDLIPLDEVHLMPDLFSWSLVQECRLRDRSGQGEKRRPAARCSRQNRKQIMARITEAHSGVWNNFHTHTYRCRHAEGDIEDYVNKAAELGMNRIGFSEHAFIVGEERPLRMSQADVPEYIEACRAADGQNGIRVLCGVECDYDPADESFFREYYLGEMGMDYLVGSVHGLKGQPDIMDVFSNAHFGVKELRIYTDLYVRMIESRLFTFCAHPDLFGRPIEVGEGGRGWDENAAAAAKEILDAAQANDTVLEINTSGIWKTRERGHNTIIYPRWQFWGMASGRNLKVIVNTDAHSVEKLDSGTDYGMELIRRFNLQRVELEQE